VNVGIIRDKKEQAISMPVPGSSGDRSEWRDEWNVEVPAVSFDSEKFREQMDQMREQIREATREGSEWQRDLQKEMARIGPEIQKSMEESRRAIEKAMREQQRALRDLRDLRIDIDEQ